MKVLVLLSGGQDSTTCLAQACHDFPGEVMAVGFDYGQRHRIELTQAQRISDIAKVPFEVISLPFISSLTDNSLTRKDMPIEHKEGELPSTFVDGRNLFFLSVAAVRAKQKGVRILYTGVCQTDYSGYPDCRDDFVKSLQQSLNLAMDYEFDIRTPLMFLTKAETVRMMETLGKLEWLKESHTCYEGKRPACGRCPACLLRLKGFLEVGIKDPLEYE
ncbi:7-cyano-7-deazaguanine synthase QueC [Candidatus Marinamargulisbacteria bacterium SCGC AG-343-D04]|nr:7-cyano-7-deazaguanine synthase QueC [Candidatus Marinamargulisbacteria bacterium SCGC AG-343-D04]